MAAESYDDAFEHVLGSEGGYTGDRRDRGNWDSGKIGQGRLKGTKWGISAMSYPNLDIKNLTQDDAKRIYKRDYWDRLRLDELPAGVDLAVFDAAVNSGGSRAVKWLQQALGVPADGLIGPQTLDAADNQDPEETIRNMSLTRMDFLEELYTFPVYGKGWRRRVNSVRETALEMHSKGGRTPVGRPRSPDTRKARKRP